MASHTAIFRDEEQRNVKAATQKANTAEKSTLGDLDALAALKAKMEGK